MSLRDRLTQAAGAVGSATGTLTERGTATAKLAAQRTRESVADGSWVHGALRAMPPPAAPAVQPWEYSIAALVRQHPKVPGLAVKALGFFNRFGALRIGPDGVGFDDDDVAWGKAVAVRTRNAFELMTTDALEREVDRIRHLLPPVPGRKWVVTRVAEALATVMLAAAERAGQDKLDSIDIACEVVHTGRFGREKVLRAGLFGSAMLALEPQVHRSLLATAEAHGVAVHRNAGRVVPADAAERIAALRRRTDTVGDLLAGLDEDPEGQPDGEPDARGGADG